MQSSRKITIWFCLALWSALSSAGAAEVMGGVGPEKCDLVLFGDIEQGDEAKFTQELTGVLKRDCQSPNVYLYSRGGNVEEAIAIAKQVFDLRLRTNSPEVPSLYYSHPRDGARSCPWLPGHAERTRRFGEILHANIEAAIQAANNHTPMPDTPVFHGDYDPRCTCASACFFIWAAGAERAGDVIKIHRPYIEPQQYAELGAEEAQATYKKLADKVRDFLIDIGIDHRLIERMMSINSEHALALSPAELTSLRIAPYWEELKLANCPKDETDVAGINDQEEAEQLTRFGRDVCWSVRQKTLRRPLIESYLKINGGPRALLELYAFQQHLDPDDPGLDDYLSCRHDRNASCENYLTRPHPGIQKKAQTETPKNNTFEEKQKRAEEFRKALDAMDTQKPANYVETPSSWPSGLDIFSTQRVR